mmetsp:Transcript_11637/g.23596  ORF Transcript_11637/g.23596 Transcript_11637/m.23596 type:complete len:177 (+) Transcript_11637:177-707(+)
MIHNAGSVQGGREEVAEKGAIFAEQKLALVRSSTMLKAFDVNCVGPLRVQQALTAQMASPGGKVVLLSTGMASIADNGSGGLYPYRCSKAAMNMLAKGLACDLKEKGICVCPVAPGFVATEFGMGSEEMAKMGAAPVEQATRGILEGVDTKMGTVEGSGVNWMIPTKGGEPKIMPW